MVEVDDLLKTKTRAYADICNSMEVSEKTAIKHFDEIKDHLEWKSRHLTNIAGL